MKLKYIFLVLFGIIIFLILNNIDTFNIGIPYKFIPPVDTPIPQELSEMAVTEWDTREEAKAALDQWIDDVDGNIDDNIIFIPKFFDIPLTLYTGENVEIKYTHVNVVGSILAHNPHPARCKFIVLNSIGSRTNRGTTLQTFSGEEVDVSTTEFIEKLAHYGEGHIRGHPCVRHSTWSTGSMLGGNYRHCNRYLPMSRRLSLYPDMPRQYFMNTGWKQRYYITRLNLDEIIAPFLYLTFGQLNIPNLVMPDRFSTFFTGGNLLAFECSSVGDAGDFTTFHLTSFIIQIFNGLFGVINTETGLVEIIDIEQVDTFLDTNNDSTDNGNESGDDGGDDGGMENNKS